MDHSLTRMCHSLTRNDRPRLRETVRAIRAPAIRIKKAARPCRGWRPPRFRGPSEPGDPDSAGVGPDGITPLPDGHVAMILGVPGGTRRGEGASPGFMGGRPVPTRTWHCWPPCPDPSHRLWVVGGRDRRRAMRIGRRPRGVDCPGGSSSGRARAGVRGRGRRSPTQGRAAVAGSPGVTQTARDSDGSR